MEGKHYHLLKRAQTGRAWFESGTFRHATSARREARKLDQWYVDGEGNKHKLKMAIVIACEGECSAASWS